ncbi:ATP-dependent protease ClpP, protease subunit [Parageobacillus thermantarcticus]|uniref:ATP-dependent Clp protease proteolytic subunit n=1 Tax=Parageobacillus thermantarcticus TaxID=186116 RepID=A0A1I0THB8_9BACL|nr:head maturation protease, ClpP-related [Parageobacillus thermantarcticus]SFA50953.1 ATP-dependent protease ClpP, protease subunit [Parageobacillus thermantarcticus]
MVKKMELPKINKRFEVLNKAENDEADLYMYGTIGKGWFADISANDVRHKLSNITAKTINVHINSVGGDVFESIAIHNILKNHKATINVYIDGYAASGASVIAMAGDKVIMPRNTMMMIHKAWTLAAGNAKELRKIANDLEKIDTAVLESYTSRFVGDRSELERLLDEETLLTAEECKILGLCDEISDEIELPDEEDEQEETSVKEEILNKYIAASLDGKAVAQTTENNHKPKEEKPMNNASIIYQFLSSLTRSENN